MQQVASMIMTYQFLNVIYLIYLNSYKNDLMRVVVSRE